MKNLTLLFSLSAFLILLTPVTDGGVLGQTFVFGPETYIRDESAPQTVTRKFTVQEPGSEFTLFIQNGDLDGNRITSATVDLNGVRVAGPSDFSKQVSVIAKPVVLQQQNSISVEVRGKPGSLITVTIREGRAPLSSPKYTYFTNPYDPLLLRQETPTGEVIDYFGDRDINGLATSLYGFTVTYANGDVARYYLDEAQRPILIGAPNGIVFKLEWQSDTFVLIKVIMEDGDAEVTVPVDLTAQTASLPVTQSWQRSIFSLASFAHPLSLKSNPPLPAQSASPYSTTVNVTQCGAPTNNAFVGVQVAGLSGPPILARPIGGGQYRASLPAPPPNFARPVARACRSVETTLAKACEIAQSIVIGVPRGTPQTVICNSLQSAILNSPYRHSALAVGAACRIGFAAFNFLCAAPKNCAKGAEFVDRAISAPISYRAVATLYGITACSGSVSAPPTGPFPPLSINFPCNCRSGLGARLFSTQREIRIDILPPVADFTSEIYLLSPTRRFIGTNRDEGAPPVNIGSFGVGQELVFGIFVRETGHTFRTGPGSNNPDGLVHARVECLGDGRANIYFEDSFGGGDRDFNDAVFQIISGRFVRGLCP